MAMAAVIRRSMMSGITAACVETSFLDMGRAGFQDSYSRLRGHHRPEPTRAEGAQQPAEVIRQDMQAHLRADGFQSFA